MLASLNAISRQQDKSGPITTFYHIPGIKTQWKKNTEKKLGNQRGKKRQTSFPSFSVSIHELVWTKGRFRSVNFIKDQAMLTLIKI